jgi:hypothetical protein
VNTLTLHRHQNIFTERADLRERLERHRAAVQLSPDQLLHAEVPATYLVRLGKLRVSEFLEDGREITRAVLQAGALLTTDTGGPAPDAAADTYLLGDCVLMALGETELWRVPPEALR